MTSPVTLRLDDRVFFDTRQALALAARVDVTHCISLARRQVTDFLLQEGVDEDLTRLAKGDLAETLLAKRAMAVASHESYTACRTTREREDVLELTLAEALFAWLQTRVGTRDQTSRLGRAAQAYFTFRTGAF